MVLNPYFWVLAESFCNQLTSVKTLFEHPTSADLPFRVKYFSLVRRLWLATSADFVSALVNFFDQQTLTQPDLALKLFASTRPSSADFVLALSQLQLCWFSRLRPQHVLSRENFFRPASFSRLRLCSRVQTFFAQPTSSDFGSVSREIFFRPPDLSRLSRLRLRSCGKSFFDLPTHSLSSPG